MSSLPSDPSAAILRLAEELQALRELLAAQARTLEQLVSQNQALADRLTHSEAARADLVAQTEHIVELLAESRRELRSHLAG